MLTDVLHLFKKSRQTSSRKESDDVCIFPQEYAFRRVEEDTQKVLKIFECFQKNATVPAFNNKYPLNTSTFSFYLYYPINKLEN